MAHNIAPKLVMCLEVCVFFASASMYTRVQHVDKHDILGETKTSNVLQCSRECSRTGGCQSFTFAEDSGMCRLATAAIDEDSRSISCPACPPTNDVGTCAPEPKVLFFIKTNYCKIFFIPWTFSFVFFMGRESMNLLSQQNIYSL